MKTVQATRPLGGLIDSPVYFERFFSQLPQSLPKWHRVFAPRS